MHIAMRRAAPSSTRYAPLPPLGRHAVALVAKGLLVEVFGRVGGIHLPVAKGLVCLSSCDEELPCAATSKVRKSGGAFSLPSEDDCDTRRDESICGDERVSIVLFFLFSVAGWGGVQSYLLRLSTIRRVYASVLLK